MVSAITLGGDGPGPATDSRGQRELGKTAEASARKFLEAQGLRYLESNYRSAAGEIDLIMRDQELLVFVEVRYRREADFGAGIETVSRSKQSRLIKTAWYYLLEKHLVDKAPCRFDVIGIAHAEKICWIKNAFEVQY